MQIQKKPITSPSKPNGSGRKPHVVLLLDASGSMRGYEASVVSTFNEYVKSVINSAKTISLYTFEQDNLKELVFKEPPGRLKKLTPEDYVLGGMTPLYDAMGIVMNKFDGNGADDRPVQFVTHTDGMENHSSEWTKSRLDGYIDDLTRRKGWLFSYLMEGIEGRRTLGTFQGLKMGMSNAVRGQAMGMMASVTSNYAATGINEASAYTVSGGDEVDIDEGEMISPMVTSISPDEEEVT